MNLSPEIQDLMADCAVLQEVVTNLNFGSQHPAIIKMGVATARAQTAKINAQVDKIARMMKEDKQQAEMLDVTDIKEATAPN